MLQTRKKPTIDFGKAKRKSITVPDQSMSIEEIVKRYTRGIPVDIKMNNPVYIDQSGDNALDLEKAARLDFAQKHELAQQIKEDAQNAVDSANERRKEREKLQQQHAQTTKDAQTGMNTLDNTMPVDTNQKTK